MQGTGIGDNASIPHMVVFRLKTTADSVMKVKYRLKILFEDNEKCQGIYSKNEKKENDNEQTKLTIQIQVT